MTGPVGHGMNGKTAGMWHDVFQDDARTLLVVLASCIRVLLAPCPPRSHTLAALREMRRSSCSTSCVGSAAPDVLAMALRMHPSQEEPHCPRMRGP